jgi:hypothetical protein
LKASYVIFMLFWPFWVLACLCFFLEGVSKNPRA